MSRKIIVRNNRLALEALPEPLKPTPHRAQRPVPKPRKKAPVSLPRLTRPRPGPINRRVNKLIREITPYYSPEKIEKFKKELKFIKRAEITEKKKALKGNVANYGFSIVNDSDPSIQLARGFSLAPQSVLQKSQWGIDPSWRQRHGFGIVFP